MAFNKAPVSKPRIACLGDLDLFEDGKRTKSGNYVMTKYHISARAGENIYGNFLWRPEWFNPAFDPSTLPNNEQAVYSMHIIANRKNDMSTLAGLCGSEDNFNLLQEKAERELTQYTDEEVSDFLRRTVFGDFGGAMIGYELKQAFEMNDATGKKDIPLDKYEVGGWFYPSEKTLDAKRKRAESNKEKAAEAGQRPTFLAAF